MTLVLNADDPLVSKFGAGREGTLYFGADHLDCDTNTNDSIYDDGKYCPICKKPMEYEYYHYNHIGKYRCTACGFARPDTRWALTGVDLDEGKIVINAEYKIPLTFNGIYHCYNTLAAFAAADLAGISKEKAAEALGGYILKSGRIVDFTLGKTEGRLLLSKHENSISYDRSIDVVANDPKKVNVMIIVDAISRKYFTSDSSWLWDIDFEKLNLPNVSKIILAGKYCNDLAVRFEAAGISNDKTEIFESIPDAASYAGDRDEYLYVITCFSDKEKILSIVTRKEIK
jgi:UDP-N-acetylmuramyl tripeptide synthase